MNPKTQTSQTPIQIPKPEQCGWGPNCPIYKSAEEDWDREHQKQLQQADKNTQTNAQPKYPSQNQDVKSAQIQNLQHTKNYQTPQNQPTQKQSFNVPDHYTEQIHLRREWEEKMEQLNEKYGLDCFSDLELDSESDEGENYQYEHTYEMLI